MMGGRLIVRGDAELIRVVLGLDSGSMQDWNNIPINGVSFTTLEVSTSLYGGGYCGGSEIEITLIQAPCKSQEEIAAEGAVRKAQESLKAAEEVLNKVKKEK